MNERYPHRINIAIDGPAGAGKSTVARLVASELHYVYVDTGAMYRAVTFVAQSRGLQLNDSDSLASLASGLDISLLPGEGGQIVLADGKDVTGLIRSREVTAAVSLVSANAAVRSRMSELQRRMAAAKGVVMDGRDIGTHVLPDAELKVFLTASPRERASRRFLELGDKPAVTLDQLEGEIALRDRMDSEREIAPLRQAADALLIDSTGRSIAEIVDEIVSLGRTAAQAIAAREN
ncbi:(d)CMP kinase [Cohnella hashimotonis]|uniref:Cytidylate kinase n=1 Tax=Cohnella hashimotonis TaxID=2826895 RepID=A0ABT6TF50_9BACL|nr:(d)CMP kinase [Cohnella hashimotonis]MDI4645457.1 (d)CMP kinase [Cohnella hashimotonis]